ncbi:TPA: hypothetical protein UOA80_000097 [Stenotrophomonas maltophilia]|nr:hypothetical protein [Stenotrophomonas maltophilia]
MERERPDYLPQIPGSRWEFPWLGMWAVILIGMVGAGIWLHLRTGDAWTARFTRTAEAPPLVVPSTAEVPTPAAIEEAKRQATIAEIRLRRAAAEGDAAKRQREELRCISGVAFRRIPGGWENVPGMPCP